jgi:hypothetical protein
MSKGKKFSLALEGEGGGGLGEERGDLEFWKLILDDHDYIVLRDA